MDGDSLFQLFMRLRGRINLNREPARLPLPGSVLLPDMGVAAARSGDFFAALSGSDRRVRFPPRRGRHLALLPWQARAGRLRPAGRGSAQRARRRGRGSDAARAAREPPNRGEGYWIMTMGIAHAYPATAKLYSWQRSSALTPGETRCA